MHRLFHFFSFRGRIGRADGLCHMVLSLLSFYFGSVLILCAIMGTDSPNTAGPALIEAAAVAAVGVICLLTGMIRIMVILVRRFRDIGKKEWHAVIYCLGLFTLPPLFGISKIGILLCIGIIPFLIKGWHTGSRKEDTPTGDGKS